MSLMSGLDPSRTGVHTNEQRAADSDVRMLAEILSENGFFTAGAVGGYPLSSRFPVARGFERFDDRMEDARNASALERDAGLVVQAAQSLLRGRGTRRTFLWVHFYDAHDPYAPPQPYAARFANDLYQGEIARMDAALADLLSSLEPALGREGLLVCVVADHGEALGEHGEPTHGFFLYEPTVRVPWILAGPRVPRGRILPGPVALDDVTPTLLQLLDLPVPEDLDGHPLSWNATPETERIYLETELPLHGYGFSPLRGVVQGSLKYIEAPRPELYDLSADTPEQHNLLPGHDFEVSELKAWIAEHGMGSGASSEPPADPVLAALGYIGTMPAEGPALTDPKDGLGLYVRFQLASRLLEEGRPGDALPVLEELLVEHPGSGAQLKRAVALRMLGRTDEAEAALLALERQDPGQLGIQLELGRIELWAGRAPSALPRLDRYLSSFPDHAEALLLRGAAREGLHDVAGAEADYRAAMSRNPSYGDASLRLAALLVKTGRIEEARRHLSAHLSRHPEDELARGLLGSL